MSDLRGDPGSDPFLCSKDEAPGSWKVLRLAGETKCPVYPGKSSYVGVLDSCRVYCFTLHCPANTALLFAMDPSSSAHNAPCPNAGPLQ